MVGLLNVAYMFSYVDRYVLGLLIEPIKADLELSDEQIGWVLGPAFAVFYATMGLPFGWLVDRKRRTWIIAFGIAVWSLATAACGLARSFAQLFVARMTVGIGEAVLSPAAFSVIADSFPPERRGKPIATYSMAISLGAGVASLIGAAVLGWARSGPQIVLPGFGPISPWQLTFLIVGLPGLLLALVFLFVREPARINEIGGTEVPQDNGMRDTLRFVGRHWRVYLCFVLLPCTMVIVAYSQAFLPAAFERNWGWPPERYALWYGAISLTVGPATYLAMGALSDRLTQRGMAEAPLWIVFVASLVLVPSTSGAMLMPGPYAALALIAVGAAAIGAVTAVAVTALLLITPAAIRGQIVALYYMAISITGLLLGPTTVGVLSTRVFGEGEIRLALAALPVLYGAIPLLLIPVTLRLYRRQAALLAAP